MYPEHIPTDLGKEGNKNLCKALDGAASTLSDADASYAESSAVSKYLLQKFLNRMPAVQRQINTFSLTQEKSERSRRAHLDDLTRSQRWFPPHAAQHLCQGFPHFDGDWQ